MIISVIEQYIVRVS